MFTRHARLLPGLALVAAALLNMTGAQAQTTYPEKPVHIVVAYSPGGIFDIFGRAIAQRLTTKWNQAVIIDNKPGASEIIGATTVSRAPPDGYTLFLSSETALETNPVLYTKLTYDPVKDFEPIIRIAEGTRVLVVPSSSSYKSLQDLEDAARKEPGKISYGTSGVGTPVNILQNWYGLQTHTTYNHIPYRGTEPAVQDLLGGVLQFTWAPLPLVKAFISNGKLRPLVVTGKSRMVALPDTPTLTELGHPDMDMDLMLSLVAPAGTPPAVVNKIADDVRAILRDKSFDAQITQANAFTAVADTPAEFAASLKSERHSFEEKVRALNVHLD